MKSYLPADRATDNVNSLLIKDAHIFRVCIDYSGKPDNLWMEFFLKTPWRTPKPRISDLNNFSKRNVSRKNSTMVDKTENEHTYVRVCSRRQKGTLFEDVEQ